MQFTCQLLLLFITVLVIPSVCPEKLKDDEGRSPVKFATEEPSVYGRMEQRVNRFREEEQKELIQMEDDAQRENTEKNTDAEIEALLKPETNESSPIHSIVSGVLLTTNKNWKEVQEIKKIIRKLVVDHKALQKELSNFIKEMGKSIFQS